MGGKRRKLAHEPAERRAGGGNDDDGIGSCGHGGLLIVSVRILTLWSSYNAPQKLQRQ
jgi:hypothetical protein